MKKITYLILCVVAGAAVLSMAGCNDSGYKPGPEVVTDNPIYFHKDNAVEIEMEKEEGLTYAITVSRKSGGSELTVPVDVIYADEGIIVPESVTFAASETESELQIGFSSSFQDNLPQVLNVRIGGGNLYTDPYSKELEGTSVYRGEFTVWGEWEHIGDASANAGSFSGTTPVDVPEFTQKIYTRGNVWYKVENFLLNNDGYDFVFKIDGQYNIIPPEYEMLGFIEGTSGSGYRWYFYKPGNDNNAATTEYRIPCYIAPDNNITYIYFYLDKTHSYYNFTFDPEKKISKMNGYARWLNSNSAHQGRLLFTFEW